jgi:hypothetical protein
VAQFVIMMPKQSLDVAMDGLQSLGVDSQQARFTASALELRCGSR